MTAVWEIGRVVVSCAYAQFHLQPVICDHWVERGTVQEAS
jgi:hypothetical protein